MNTLLTFSLKVPEGLNTQYKPLPRKPESSKKSSAPLPSISQDEALSALIKGKGGRRTAVYSGTKRSGFFGAVPSLYDLCVRILQEHVENIEECGGLPFDVLQPILERASPQALQNIEEFNPYLMQVRH